MNKDLDCCTHYNRQGYYTGYVMLPVFRVRICRNCGEVHAEWSRMADCFNYSCPFRVNETCSVPNGCECTACPNRCTGDFSIAWNRTLTDEELEKIRREIK